MSKQANQRIHFYRRLYERWGIKPTRKVHDSIRENIRSGHSITIEVQSNRLVVHLVQWADQNIPVVYDRKRKVLVTALPKHVYSGYAKSL